MSAHIHRKVDAQAANLNKRAEDIPCACCFDVDFPAQNMLHFEPLSVAGVLLIEESWRLKIRDVPCDGLLAWLMLEPVPS